MNPKEDNRFETLLDGIMRYRESGKTAVVCQEAEVSYRQLIRDAMILSTALKASGTGKGSFVILAMKRSVHMIKALLGILYAGAAYVAVDRTWPSERLAYIQKDCQAACVLDDTLYESLCQEGRAILRRRGSGGEEENPQLSPEDLPRVEGSDAIAVYYTSGSTGEPKGTVTHHSVFLNEAMPVPDNICSCETARLCDVVFSMGNFAYGAVACDIFYALFNGMTLVLASEKERLSPALLGACMLRHHADALLGTPSMLLGYLEDESFAAGFAGLKRVILTGEALSEDAASRIASCTQAVLFDAFGASEVRNYAFTRLRPGEAIELGQPTHNAVLLVLDEAGRLQEAGKLQETEEAFTQIKGELCIGGTPGRYGYYLNHPELTAQKFTVTEEYGRIYHTGDLARIRRDGSIALAGRADGMRKLHGQRLELGEVERMMERFPGISRAAADIRGQGPDAVLLGWYKGKGVEEDRLRAFLAERLPAYMVPAQLTALEQFPLNDSGKLDRRALPEISVTAKPAAPPRNDLEKLLCDAFARVLRRFSLPGRDSGFFALGGDSIKAMMLISLLEEDGYHLSMADLLKAPTPAKLAAWLAQGKPADRSAGKPAFDENSQPNQTVNGQASQNPMSLRSTLSPSLLPDELMPLKEDPNIIRVLPVSNATDIYLRMKRLGISDRRNVTRARLLVSGILSEEAFCDRVEHLVRNHPALRSSFVQDQKGRFWQVFYQTCQPVIYYKDIRRLSREVRERFADGFLKSMDEGDSLFQAACLPVSEDKSVILLCVDHTIADGISVQIMAQELTDPHYRQYTEDALFSHRERVLRDYRTPPALVTDYYRQARPLWKSGESLRQDLPDRRVRRVCLTREETGRLNQTLADRGILLYTWVQYCYGRALLDTIGGEELWLLTLESGRYPDWKDDMRVVGNLIIGTPVGISRDLTAEAFQERLFLLRSGPWLSDSSILQDGKWMGIGEGITSNLFDGLLKEEGPVLEFPKERPRTGNSMELTDGALVIELRHPDQEKDNRRYDQVEVKLKAWLLRILSL